MKIGLQDGLPFVTASIVYRGRSLEIENVLVDTGSLGTVFSIDTVVTIGLEPEYQDTVHRIRGVGGAEFVFTKRLDRLSLGELQITDFEVEIGAMNYGFEIQGIIGMDFLIQIGAIIDLARLEIYRTTSPEH